MDFDFMDPPDPAFLVAALRSLYTLGALVASSSLTLIPNPEPDDPEPDPDPDPEP